MNSIMGKVDCIDKGWSLHEKAKRHRIVDTAKNLLSFRLKWLDDGLCCK